MDLYLSFIFFRVGESGSFDDEAQLVNKVQGMVNNGFKPDDRDGLVNGKAQQNGHNGMQAMGVAADGSAMDILG